MSRYARPQPYRDLEHTADAGVEVEGTSAEEVLCRLVVAYGQAVCGVDDLAPLGDLRVDVPVTPGGADRAVAAVDLLRDLHYRLAARRELPVACEVLSWDGRGLSARVALARYDAAACSGGLDVKAITYHGARCEPDPARPGRWIARAIFDV